MTADFRHIHFLKSVAAPWDLPPDAGREVAFAGRSNAGKSSALNAIVGIKGLARVSKTPGRTRLINIFELEEQRRLVDLPGYGYARVPQAIRTGWAQLMQGYFASRASLAGLVLVMDIRQPLTAFDAQLLAWVAPLELPVQALLTKADKLSRSAAFATQRAVSARLEGHAGVQVFSALSGDGVEAARQVICDWLAGA